MNTYKPSKDIATERAAEEGYSFQGLQVFYVCIGVSLVCNFVLMVLDAIQGKGLPDISTILGTYGLGVLVIFLLRERSKWGYLLGILYSVFAFVGGLGQIREPGLFSKALGAAMAIFGIYFVVYFLSRRHYFDW